MAIQSEFELEAVVARVITRLEKYIAERGTWPNIEDQKRVLEQIRAVTRKGSQLKAMREKLRKASEVITTEIGSDGTLHEDVWDIEDYVDYRA